MLDDVLALFQAKNRPLEISVFGLPLPWKVTGFVAYESLSRLFHFHVELVALNEKNGDNLPLDELLGKGITVALEQATKGDKRHFHGICVKAAQGERSKSHTTYALDLVPEAWRLTRQVRSRIFQQKSVPDILKEVLKDYDTSFMVQGDFPPRDFCVQYRESDFDFLNRLMEEDGLWYFFTHTEHGHKMVIGNHGVCHLPLPLNDQIKYTDGSLDGNFEENCVFDWSRSQSLTAGKYTLRDYCFEMPDKQLDASATIQPVVNVGEKLPHRLNIAGNDKLELYEYPGEVAPRFDGIDPGGGERRGDLERIFKEQENVAKLRIEQEAQAALSLLGNSSCRNFIAGHRFSLTNHFNASGGPYVLTSVTHNAQQSGSEQTGDGVDFSYTNHFECQPITLPCRPPRHTPRPQILGVQTAVVVGPAGEEITTDKYGRVKVQFRWDRDGKKDADSSCWVRVATLWAGQGWGTICIPRVGQEVVVAFEDGDPNQPLIVGSVYNVDNPPPYKLPENKTQSGLKTRSTLKGDQANFNELRFDDKKGEEYIYFHAEKDFTRVVEHNDELKVGQDHLIKIEKGKSETEALQSIELKVGANSIKIDQTGITIKGLTLKLEGQTNVQMQGLTTQILGPTLLQLTGLLKMG